MDDGNGLIDLVVGLPGPMDFEGKNARVVRSKKGFVLQKGCHTGRAAARGHGRWSLKFWLGR